MKRLLAVSVLAAAVAVAGVATAQKDQRGVTKTEIVLGMHTDLSGPAATYGVSSSNAVKMRFDDLVHGPIEFDGANIEDFVILRSDGHPTYHLSVVSDDVEMAITHVVRGDDHISNTPKQILLYQAIGARVPEFAHVPLILGPDKKRLSKRHGATSVIEYARQGYLPEAMMNFLSLLGWSPGTDQEVFTRDELVKAFALEGITGADAVFNPEKLDWFNQQHIMRLAPDELAVRVRPFFEEAGLWNDDYLSTRRAWFFAVLELLRRRVRTLAARVARGQRRGDGPAACGGGTAPGHPGQARDPDPLARRFIRGGRTADGRFQPHLDPGRR